MVRSRSDRVAAALFASVRGVAGVFEPVTNTRHGLQMNEDPVVLTASSNYLKATARPTTPLTMSVDMQLQMRRNVEQMHNTASELDGWLGEIGKRDATLRGKADPTGSRSAATGDETDEEEEAREIEAAKEELRQLAAAQEVETKALSSAGDAPAKKKKAPLTHAQKYGQWDRYDVDGIVNAMEEKEADQERLRKEVVRLENQRAQHKARKAAAAATAAAEALRLQGNEAFSAARYEEAVGLYTDALNHAPRSAPLYTGQQF